jgi:hypothetical protein
MLQPRIEGDTCANVVCEESCGDNQNLSPSRRIANGTGDGRQQTPRKVLHLAWDAMSKLGNDSSRSANGSVVLASAVA